MELTIAPRNKSTILLFVLLNIGIALAVFYLEISTAPSIASGMPYIIVVVCASLWLPKFTYTVYFAIFCTALTMISGYYISVVNNITNNLSLIAFNQLAIILSIWITTTLALYRKNFAAQLKRHQMKLHAIIDESIDPIIVLNANGSIQFTSTSIHNYFLWQADELIDQHISTLFDKRIDGNTEIGKVLSLFNTKNESPIVKLPFTGELPTINKNGKPFTSEISLNKITLNEFNECFYTLILRDISKRKITEARLLWLSNHDELTGLYNRRYFNRHVKLEWRRLTRHRSWLSLIMLDVDYFKNFNDSLGHQAGDDCLQEIATILPNSLKRAGDFVARYGGEEFVILLPDTPKQGAIISAQNIQQAIDSLAIAHPSSPIKKVVTVSMGISSIQPSQDTSEEVLIQHADAALYQAKHNGRNRYDII